MQQDDQLDNSSNATDSREKSGDNLPGDNLIEERRDYETNQLSRSSLLDQPVAQFTKWLGEARASKLIDATAMALSTVDHSGQPHSRIVLLKHFDTDGFVFYTNYHSDKGRQLEASDKACVLFYWRELERQVRIEGTISKMNSTDADNYFHSRPLGSRFSAAASKQSAVVENRSELEVAVKKLENEYPDGQIPRPAHWGGYRLTPTLFEFWQGRADRLHDRFQYCSDAGPDGKADTSDSPWRIHRLSP